MVGRPRVELGSRIYKIRALYRCATVQCNSSKYGILNLIHSIRKVPILKLDKEEMLQKLREYYAKYDKIPSSKEFKGRTSYCRYFGSWNTALREAGIPSRTDPKTIIEHPCERCSTNTRNPVYCSRSCAAKTNGSLFPKRTRKRFQCQSCQVEVSYRRKLCSECFSIENKMLSDLAYGKGSNKFSAVHDHSRRKFNQSNNVCTNCQWPEHIEVCHIKPVASFPLSALVSEVNDASNIVLLCPNCHWMLDHGRLLFYEPHALNQTELSTHY